MKQYKVGILGGTGMVGQRFIQLLDGHPWFSVTTIAASPRSAGVRYADAVKNRWKMATDIPEGIKNITVKAVEDDREKIASEVDFVFSALDMEKEDIRRIEEEYAALNVPVVSNNSAHRWTEDVPLIMPEINSEAVKLIDIQRKKRGWNKGLIAVKPNCSVQSYVSVLTALKAFKPQKVQVVSMQAISGAGKNFESWPEMVDNLIPYIGGEEEKSEKEPMKIWGHIENNKLKIAEEPVISATCIRVPASDGHMASVSVTFEKKPTKVEILKAIEEFSNPIKELELPSAPGKFIQYFEDPSRPQTGLDRDYEQGMGISMGRLEEDTHFDWKFVSLSHNTIRGAAGGAILMAELLVKKGYIEVRIN
jgi:aspartate-semialdehyde dehydrogenase